MTRQLSFWFAFALISCCAIAQESKLTRPPTSPADTAAVHQLLRDGREFILRPGESSHDLDSALLLTQLAETKSRQSHYDQGLLLSYIQYSMTLREAGERQQGKDYAQKAADEGGQYKIYGMAAEAMLELSQYYNAYVHEEWIEKIRLHHGAITFYKKANDKRRVAWCLQNLADLHQFYGTDSVALAMEELNEALAIYHSINYLKVEGIYDLLNSCHIRLGNPRAALRYGLMALQTAEEVGDSSLQICTFNNRVGLLYGVTGDFPKSNEYFIRAYVIARKYKDYQSIYYVLANLTVTFSRMKMSVKAMPYIRQVEHEFPSGQNIFYQCTLHFVNLIVNTDLKNYERAQQDFDELERKMERPEVPDDSRRSYYKEILQYLFITRQYSLVGKWLQRQENNAREDKMSAIELSLNQLYHFRLDSVQGAYLSAINHFQKYKAIQDSLHDTKKNLDLNALSVEYETVKKDNELKLQQQSIRLLKQQTVIQKDEIARSSIVRNTILIVALLLMIIASLTLYQFALKQRNAKEIQYKNDALQALLNEKEWLLKEVNHRVKNNLHTIVSLLESQSDYLKDDALDAIKNSQHRIHAMSLIHQKLYQSENVYSIRMSVYFVELIDYLKESFDVRSNVFFHTDIAPIELDPTQAIPLGLILNEAITNSIKYAFPGDRPGTITVSLKEKEDNKIELIMQDNGNGFSLSEDNSSSLGLRLMKGISEEIGAQLTISSIEGTRIALLFSKSKSVKLFHSQQVPGTIKELI